MPRVFFNLALLISALLCISACIPEPDAKANAKPEKIGVRLTAGPTKFNAKADIEQISLAWDVVEGADSYVVLRGNKAGGPYEDLASPKDTEHLDTRLKPGTTYYYVVRGVNAVGAGPDSSETSATPLYPLPAPPDGLTATGGDSEIVLSWHPVRGAFEYTLLRGAEASGPFSQIYAGQALEFVDGVVSGVTYYYVVRALNADTIASDDSAVASARAFGPPGQVFAAATTGAVRLSWAADPSATSYEIYRGTTSGGPYTFVGFTANLSYDDGSVAEGTTYYYVVRTVTAAGTSSDSLQVSAQPLYAPANLPSLSLVSRDGFIGIEWSGNPGATHHLFQGWTPTGPWIQIYAGTATGYAVPATNGVLTYFYVAALNGEGVAGPEAYASGEARNTNVLLCTVNYSNHDVHYFNPHVGQPEAAISPIRTLDGELYFDTVDSLAFNPASQEIFVLETTSNRISVYPRSASGVVYTPSRIIKDAGWSQPAGITIATTQGELIVADRWNNAIFAYSASGTGSAVLRTLTSAHITAPVDVAYDPVNDELFVLLFTTPQQIVVFDRAAAVGAPAKRRILSITPQITNTYDIEYIRERGVVVAISGINKTIVTFGRLDNGSVNPVRYFETLPYLSPSGLAYDSKRSQFIVGKSGSSDLAAWAWDTNASSAPARYVSGSALDYPYKVNYLADADQAVVGGGRRVVTFDVSLSTAQNAVRWFGASRNGLVYPRGLAYDPVFKRLYTAHMTSGFVGFPRFADTASSPVVSISGLAYRLEVDTNTGKVFHGYPSFELYYYEPATGYAGVGFNISGTSDDFSFDPVSNVLYMLDSIGAGGGPAIESSASSWYHNTSAAKRLAVDGLRNELYAYDPSERLITVYKPPITSGGMATVHEWYHPGSGSAVGNIHFDAVNHELYVGTVRKIFVYEAGSDGSTPRRTLDVSATHAGIEDFTTCEW